MAPPLRLLLVEDNPDDAELILRELHRAGFEPAWQRVDTEAAYVAALDAGVDIVLSDYQMPAFNGIRALELLRGRGTEIPFILISGTIGEDLAVAAMREGASDYLLKDRLIRLPSAVTQALEKARLNRERQLLQAEIAVRQQRLDAFFSRAPAGLALLDRELRYVQINPTLAEFNGQPIAAHIGRTLAEVIPNSAPMLEPLFRQVLATGQPLLNVELSSDSPKHPGVERSWTESFFPVLGADGQPAGIGVVVVETTERRQAEARVREQAAMLDLAHDAIIVRDLRSSRITYWNHGAELLYGWTADEAIGREIGELLFFDRAVPAEISAKLLQTGEWVGEHRHRNKAGRELIVRGRATLVRDARGEPKSVLIINFDLTEKKNLETQILRAQRMEGIGTLAAGVAHDLNNILAPIMMSVPLLRQDLPLEQREGIISTIEKSAARGAQIVRQVLTFGQGVDGERTALQIGELIAEVRQIAGQTFPPAITVETSAETDLWPVNGDGTQLHQVLLNLAVNARDAMPEGGLLRIHTSNLIIDENFASMLPHAKAGRFVQIDVSDTGCGIPPETLERIFDPFFTTKSIGKGTGLGLSTAFGIIRSHGGFIHASSTVGKGTRFQMFLPAASTPDTVDEDRSAIPPPPAGGGEVVLVVDDEETVRRAAVDVLSGHGYEVLVAADGIQALAIFAMNASRIALVLTDIRMPNMDGVALIRALSKMRPGLPIIASTGAGEESQRAAIQTLAVTATLDKPFNAGTMLRAFHEALKVPVSELPGK